MLEQKESNEFCVGTVTVITSNNLVITGLIKRDKDQCDCNDQTTKPKDEEEFVTFTLTKPLLAIPGSGITAPVQPFYVIGDTIRINVAQIETVGPTNPCLPPLC